MYRHPGVCSCTPVLGRSEQGISFVDRICHTEFGLLNATHNLPKVISSYLLSLLPTKGTTTSQPPEALIQATSSLIDIFSDESSPWDVNFRQGQWENQLAHSVDGVRKAVKSIDKRRGEDGRELRRRGEEVLENLVAFVKYRRRLKL